MRKYGTIPCHQWQDPTIKQFGTTTSFVALYLRTSPHSNMIHLFRLDPAYAALDLGISIDEYNQALTNLISIGYCEHDEINHIVWLENAMLFDIGTAMKAKDNRTKGMEQLLKMLPESSIKNKFLARYGRKYRIKFAPQKPPNEAPLQAPLQAPLKQGAVTGTEIKKNNHTQHTHTHNSAMVDFEMTYEKAYLQGLLDTGSIELRCFDTTSYTAKNSKQGRVIWSSVFDTYRYLRQAIIYAMKSGWDIYHTLNPTGLPAMNTKLAPYQQTTKDANIGKYSTLFIDLDLVDKANVTDEQIEMVMTQADVVADYLVGQDFGRPTIGCSGNGAHLRYNIDLPLSSKPMIHGLLKALSIRLSTEHIKLDTVVHNPSRIARCLGTINHKGGRKSYITQFSTEPTSAASITSLASKIIPPKVKPKHFVRNEIEARPNTSTKGVDLVALFQCAGLYIGHANEPGKHWVKCINAAEHSETGDTDTVIWEGQYSTYYCSHAHCTGIDARRVVAELH